jgi:hypothetical protein
MAETEGDQLFQEVLLECNEPSQATCCAFFPTQACKGSFGPAIKPALSCDAQAQSRRMQIRVAATLQSWIARARQKIRCPRQTVPSVG